MAAIATECRTQLINALKEGVSGVKYKRCCIVLSGGVDTAAVLCAANEAGIDVTGAITVIASDAATDKPYATAIAKQAGIEHHAITITLRELLDRQLPFCVRALKTFDGMELRNSVVVSEALRKAHALGFGALPRPAYYKCHPQNASAGKAHNLC